MRLPWLGPLLVASLLIFLLHGSVSAVTAMSSSRALLASVPDAPHQGPQDREIMATVLGLVVMSIVLFNWHTLRALPGANWWLAALLVRLFAWSAGMAQNFLQPASLDLLIHLALTLSTGLAAVAVWRAYRIMETSEHSRA